MNNIKKIGFLAIISILLSCHSESERTEHYEQEINAWHKQRIQSLTRDNSWLSLAGLYWLNEGENSFGSDSTNDIIFPPKAPESIGKFTLRDNSVSISINPEIKVIQNGHSISSAQLKPNASRSQDVLRYESLHWFIIKRGNQYAVRLKDSENSLLDEFKGIDRFPVQKKWRIKATVHPNDSEQMISIPNITGNPTQINIPGTLTFSIDDKEYSLVLTPGNNSEYFVIFGDQTNGEMTYGGGRYIYVDKPFWTNTTYIDFNKAYNPPCVFTDYATCPLPPPENKLPVAVKSGEKMYGYNK